MPAATPAVGATGADKDAVERFLFHEADLIDRRAYAEWLDLFAEDGIYWLPLREGQASGRDTISLIYDDRKLLEARIRRLGHPWVHAQSPPSRTVHCIGNVVLDGADPEGGLVVRSNQIVAEYRVGESHLFAGQCTHHLAPADGSYKIRLKRLDLVDSEGEHRGIPIIL